MTEIILLGVCFAQLLFILIFMEDKD